MGEFDRLIDRRSTFSAKWDKYQGRDVLPFWVADMDFPAPSFLLDALAERVRHGILGYTRTPEPLAAVFCEWMKRNHGWQVAEEWLVWFPGVVPGLNLTAMAAAEPDGAILIPTPIYYPFLSVPANAGQRLIKAPMQRDGRRWVTDLDAMRAAADRHTHLLMIANPQNPTGRVFTKAELEALADFAERRNLLICSDEIHCGILLDGRARHIPIASAAAQTRSGRVSPRKRSVRCSPAGRTQRQPGKPAARSCASTAPASACARSGSRAAMNRRNDSSAGSATGQFYALMSATAA